MSDANQLERPPLSQWQRQALIAGLLGLGLCALGGVLGSAVSSSSSEDSTGGARWLFNRAQFFRSYLVAYVFWLGVVLGSAMILMMHHLTGGDWGRLIRRILEAATRTMPLLAVFFLPLLLGLKDLYPWARWSAEEVANSTLLQQKHLYLNVPFFLVRAAIYLAVWLGIAFLLNRWSVAQERDADPRWPRRFRALSAVGLILFGLTITFASIDWIMSIEPLWYSTIYGMMVGTGMLLSGFAFAIAVVVFLAPYSPFAYVIQPGFLRDLGSLLLAFVMLWAYMAFSQFLLIWAGDLPEEIPWYLKRLEGGWQAVGLALIVFHFFLPFALLLSRNIKQTTRTLGTVVGIVLVMRYVDLFWMITPAFYPYQGFRIHWMDVAAVIGIGGIWLALFLWELGRRSLVFGLSPVTPEANRHE